MDSELINKFKEYLNQFPALFEGTYNEEAGNKLKAEINTFDRNDAVSCWLELLEAQGPVEKINDYKYEIYDVNNFLNEENSSSEDYIHLIEFSENESTASVFMKFYLVFYCLVNGTKSSEYKINNSRME